MEIKFQIEYHELVVREDIPKLSMKEKTRIKSAIENKLQIKPDLFGKPLRKSLKNYRSLRVGNYRIIYSIQTKKIKIFIIQHRSVVYKNAQKR